MDRAMCKPGAERLEDYKGMMYVWCVEDVPVAMAAAAGHALPLGMQRVSLVYTPPDSRKRGFAGALVGTLTASLLEQGQPYVGICTDAANPTSNHVYESVGYEFINDGINYSFK